MMFKSIDNFVLVNLYVASIQYQTTGKRKILRYGCHEYEIINSDLVPRKFLETYKN
jgi:hypothetical protein